MKVSDSTVNNKFVDSHGRLINYVRISVTDRCNLRCFYCMPERGMKFLPKEALMTYEEMLKFISILANHGISKVRITGGEPFVRKELISFLSKIQNIPGISELHITTNGVLTYKYINQLKQLGISSVNLSLDTLDPERFKIITRRDEFDQVMKTFHALIENGIRTKINMVVIDGKNADDILPMVNLVKDYPVDVRFIEEMPFNGTGANYQNLTWNHHRILDNIKEAYPMIRKIEDKPSSTSTSYHIPEFKGNVGIIAAYSRTFCGSCNRLRVTSQGKIQTCLYDFGVLNIRDIIRSGAQDEEIAKHISRAIGAKARDGFEAEKNRGNSPIKESMSAIGG